MATGSRSTLRGCTTPSRSTRAIVAVLICCGLEYLVRLLRRKIEIPRGDDDPSSALSVDRYAARDTSVRSLPLRLCLGTRRLSETSEGKEEGQDHYVAREATHKLQSC